MPMTNVLWRGKFCIYYSGLEIPAIETTTVALWGRHPNKQKPMENGVFCQGECRRFDYGSRTEFLHGENLSLFHEMYMGFLHEKIIFFPFILQLHFLNPLKRGGVYSCF